MLKYTNFSKIVGERVPSLEKSGETASPASPPHYTPAYNLLTAKRCIIAFGVLLKRLSTVIE